MTPTVKQETENATLYCGDSRDVLAELSNIDAVVTDPPYELAFMGKTWDNSGIAYDVTLWRRVYAAMKPGSHLLAFGGSRTYHRMACAIEDAGFEIRDQIMWLYGSGFPKSLDVSKAIDKAPNRHKAHEYRDVLNGIREAGGYSIRQVNEYFGFATNGSGVAHHWFLHKTQPCVPSKEHYAKLKRWWGLNDSLDDLYTEAERETIGRLANPAQSIFGSDIMPKEVYVTAPTTEAAKQWDGWGTALKPAHEPIVVARKPLIGTVAENVLRHGTGALNIDGCRVPPSDGDDFGRSPFKADGTRSPQRSGNSGMIGLEEGVTATPAARWPANVIHDGSDEVIAGFPTTASGKPCGVKAGNNNNVYGQFAGGIPVTGYGDSGSASRFFYCAKATKSDREQGNNHPTVKPTELMRYLCRLVTPPGGTILDPFMGSGSTGKAALAEGFKFIGIEKEPEYYAIACSRVQPGQSHPKVILPPAKKEEAEPDLFSFTAA